MTNWVAKMSKLFYGSQLFTCPTYCKGPQLDFFQRGHVLNWLESTGLYLINLKQNLDLYLATIAV